MIQNHTLAAPRAQAETPAPSLDSILRTVRAAKYRVEDEARSFEGWEERLELAGLLAEAVAELLALRHPPADPALAAAHPACSCNLLLCDGLTFDCADCGRELPACRLTEGNSINICDDC